MSASRDYTFSSSTGTYTEITGGTVYGTPTNDDQSFNAVNIGFSFNYRGTAYTQVSIQSNGFIAMGTPVSSSYTPISTGSSNNVIAALGRDLQGTGVVTSTLRAEMLGVAPDRTFTVQWKNYKGYGTGNIGDGFNFQIVLHETTNLIDLVYGSFTVNSNAKTVQVGLRGSSNSDFTNRTTTTDWTSSTAGTTNAATMALTSSVYPPAGLRYTFTPPQVSVSDSYMTVSAGIAEPGDVLAYTLYLQNSGSNSAAVISMVDPIPAGTTFNHIISPPEATYNATLNQVEWTGALPSTSFLTVSFDVNVTGNGLSCPGNIVNTATLSNPSLPGPFSFSATTPFWTRLRVVENFEANNGGFVASGVNSSWAWGTPTSGPGSAHSGVSLWATNLAGNYNASENSYITSPTYDLSAYVPIPGYPLQLTWWQWRYTESGFDYFSADVSSDGGASWTTVYGPIAGSNQSWQLISIDISTYASANFRLRFHLTSDSSVQYAGVYIDDLSIVNCAPPPAIYLIPNTQSGQSCAGSNATYSFELMNLANEAGVTASISQTGGQGALSFNPSSFFVPYGPDASVAFDVTHAVPSYLFAGQTATAGFQATSGIFTSTANVVSTAGNVWSTVPTGAPALWAASAQSNASLFYVDGKDASGNPTNRVQTYTPGTGWSSGVAHPGSPSYGGVAGYNPDNSLLYYASGFNASLTGDAAFASYNPISNTWTSLATRPQGLGLGAGGVTDNGLFVWAGGSPNAGFLNTTPVYLYNIGTGVWGTGTPLNAVGFTGSGYVMVGNNLYVGGNYFGSSAFYVYNAEANAWTPLADLPAGAGKVAPLLVYADGGIYLIGGGMSPAVASATTWRYDIAGNTWEAFTPLATAVLGSGGGFVDGWIYVFGGGSNINTARNPALHYRNIPMCLNPLLTSLTGRVTNGATGSAIAGATVSAQGLRELSAPQPTPSTTTDANGNYTLRLNPAVYNITASAPPFDPKTVVVTVTLTGATQNFVLGPAGIQVNPASFNVTTYFSETVTRTMLVTNSGYSALNLSFRETDGGFAPPAPGTIEYLPLPGSNSRDGNPPEVMLNGGGNPPPATRPAAYVYHGPNDAVQAVRILVYADDDLHDPTAVELGLQALGLTYTFFGYTPDGSALSLWMNALASNGPWDLVIMEEDNWARTAADDYTALNTYINGGGKAVAYSWATGYDSAHSSHPLWATLGGSYSSNATSAPLFWWEPTHPLFNTPEVVPQFNPVASSPYINVNKMNPLANGTALAGFTTGPAANEAGIILSKDKPAIFKGLGDYINASDRNSDGKMDAAQWWSNAANGLLNGFGGGDILWLSETPEQVSILPGHAAPITLNFDARVVRALGTYTGTLTLIGAQMPITVPVQLNVENNLLATPTHLETTLYWGQTGSDQVSLTDRGSTVIHYQFENLPMKVIGYEAFESWPPAGWTITKTVSSNCQWDSTKNVGRENTVGSGSAADADADKCGVGTRMNTALLSPDFDLTTAIIARLTFGSHYRPLGSNDRGYLDISTDGGVSWVRLKSYTNSTVGPLTEAIDLAPYLGHMVRFRFQYIAPGWDWWWMVDDFTLSTDDPWLSISPITGTLVSGAPATMVDFGYNTTVVAQPGDYTAVPFLSSPEILSNIPFSVTLHVLPAADASRIMGTVLANRSAAGSNLPLAGATVTISGPAPAVLTTGVNGTFSRWFTAAQAGSYQVTISAAGYLPFTTTFTLGTGETRTVNTTLVLNAAFLNGSPESLSAALSWGDSTAQTLTLENLPAAAQPLTATLFEVAGSYTPLEIQTVQVDIPATTLSEPTANAQAFAPAAARPARSHSVVIDSLALGKIKVLLVSSDWAFAGSLGGMDAILAAYPDLQVDIYPMEHVPTLDELTPYTVVIIGSQYTWEDTFSHNAMGDVMAAYVDAGGKVIQAFGTMHGTPSGTRYWGLGGRWQSQAYSPMTYSTFYNLYQTRHLGIYQAGHPLLRGVTTITDLFVYGGDITVRPGAQTVAFYDNGVPYLATYPGRVVALNEAIFDGADWEGDLPRLLHNAILFLAPTDVPWLSESPTSFNNLAPGASADTTVTYNSAVVDQPGTFTAWIWIDNNDPLQQGAYVPVTMTVAAAPTMGSVIGTVTLDRAPQGEGVIASGVDVTISSTLGTLTLKTDGLGKFIRYYTQNNLPLKVDITAHKDGYQDAKTSVMVTSGNQTVADLQLKLIAPWARLTPDVLDVTVIAGHTITIPLTLDNLGLQDLTFEFLEFPPTATVPLASAPVSLDPVIVDNSPVQIEQLLLDKFNIAGTLDFWVKLRQSANLGLASSVTDWTARGQYVYNSLNSVADQYQTGVKAYLDAQGLSYESYWINNSLFVHGGTLKNAQDLAAMPEVLLVRSEHYAQLTSGQFVSSMYLSLPALPGPEYSVDWSVMYLSLPPLPGPDNTVEWSPRYISLPALPGPDNSIEWSGTAWGLDFINAPAVWDTFGIRGSGVVVANIDTGVQWDHPALKQQYRGWDGSVAVHDYNWWTPTADAKTACPGAGSAPCDWAGHGSHTMGTMVGDDHVAGPTGHRTGVAPEARWMACMGCDTPPNQCSDAALTGCAQWILAPTDLDGNNPDPSKRPNVVNNSWGGGGNDPWYQSYVQAWLAVDIFPAFSIGNASTCGSAGSPGDYPESFASGAVDSSGMIASFSSKGPGAFPGAEIKPDISAPGVSVCSSVPGNGYDCTFSGTSMASPHTAGTVALLMSGNPSLRTDLEQVKTILKQTASPDVPNQGTCGAPGADKVPNYTYGYGYLDALAAVNEAIVFDIPWLAEKPSSGVVSTANSATVDVIFTSGNLPTGTYTGTLKLITNDPLIPSIKVPVAMHVAIYAAALAPASNEGSGNPTETVDYTFVVTNTGTVADVFTVAATGSWATTVPTPISLAAGAHATFHVGVTIPAAAHGGDSDTTVVTVTSQGDPSVIKTAHLKTTVSPQPVVLAVEEEAVTRVVPGGLIAYNVTLTNNGHDDSPVSLEIPIPAHTTYVPDSATGGLVFTDPGNKLVWSGTLAHGASMVFTFTVNVAADTPSGTVVICTATATSGTTVVSQEFHTLVSYFFNYLPVMSKR